MSKEPTIVVLQPGDDSSYPNDGNTVEIAYKGFLSNGTQFETSDTFGSSSFRFKLGKDQVIKCWDFAVRQMSIGQKIKLKCPSETAYGTAGVVGKIPRGEDLTFYLKLLNYT